MKTILKILALILCITTLQACIIDQEYNFNNDLSGTRQVTIDASQLGELLHKNGDSESDLLMDSIKNKLMRLKNIKNVQFDVKPGPIVTLSYSFQSPENDVVGFNIKQDGKNLIIHYDKDKKLNELGKLNNKNQEKYFNLFQINTTLNFNKKIKSTTLENAQIINGKKTLKYSCPLSQYPFEGYQIKFK